MEINCPSCNEAVLIADEDKATTIECPFCQQRFALEKPEPLRIEKTPPPPPPRPKRPSVDYSFERFILKITTMIGISNMSWAGFLARFMMIFGFLTFISNFLQFWRYWFIHGIGYKATYEIPDYKEAELPSMSELLTGMRIDDFFTHCALGLIIAGFGMLIHQLDKKSKKVID